MPDKDCSPSGRKARRQPKAQQPMTSLLSLRVRVETKLLLEKTARRRRCSLSKLLREVLECWAAEEQSSTAQTTRDSMLVHAGTKTIGIRRAFRE